jgi:ABC-type transporter Mla subunit MlaD
MSDDKHKVSDKASEIAKNIWLAGLGAYGKAFDDAQDRIDKAAKEPPRLFKELVEKGSQIEDEVRDSLSNIRKSSAETVEERIGRVRETLNLNLNRSQELLEVNRKLDALTAKVDALSEALAAATPARGKTASRGNTTSGKGRANKGLANKGLAKKGLAKKERAKKTPAKKSSARGKSAGPGAD